MIRAVLLLLSLALPAAADTARVLSGEHGDFTRLVIELPEAGGWTLGRTAAGYGFAAKAETQPGYDLSSVWQRIPRIRLSALEVDPGTGALSLVLGCECHVFPFEYQPGVIVIDIKPGPAPAGSAFETAFAAPGAPPGMVGTGRTPQGYDWLATGRGEVEEATPPLPFPLPTGSVSLEPLRQELLEQLARGAADGAVDMELPGKTRKTSDLDQGVLPWSNVHLGETPGIAVTSPAGSATAAAPDSGCADPAILDLPAWGGATPPQDLLTEAHSGLYGEFDAPDPDAIQHATRLLLFLGFGAEAGQTANLASPETPDATLGLYRSMARIIDGESDPQTPFAAMLDCEGPASLWAALARDRLPAGPGVNRDAILQGFVALPSHLRHHLGPALAGKFLARDDAEAARIIRDAMERAPDIDKASVALLDAKADLHEGDASAAQAHADTAVALAGDDAGSLVTLVDAHFRTLDPLGPETAEALLALQGETGGDTRAAVDRAIVLAMALSGQVDAAFRQQGATGQVLADLWRVAQDRATDDQFLQHAVVAAAQPVPAVAPEVGVGIAERLLALGFPDAAQAWIGPVAPGDPADKRLLAARGALAQGAARSAIALIDGLHDTGAEVLRADAWLKLGDLSAAELALAAANDPEALARVSPWTGDWAGLDPALPEPWLKVADSMAPDATGDDIGLLGRGKQAVDASLASREAITALLSSVASPAAE